jgi:undecaprenyl-diphosphatase
MEIWQAIVLGVVQGLTEFLPISSSGHLIIFPWLLGWESGGLAFDTSLHLGTLTAVLAYFWRDIWEMIRVIPYALRQPLPVLTGKSGETEKDRYAKLALLIAIASIPGVFVGVFLMDQIEAFFHTESTSDRAIATIATMLIVVGIVMLLAERIGTHTRDMRCMNWLDGAWVGIGQALAAMIPGTSRSGATLTAGLFRNLKRGDAARFSFLAGIPLIFGAGLLGLVDTVREGMSSAEAMNFLAGGVAAALVGFVTIWGLLRFLQRQSTLVFVIYRVAFGLFLFAMLIWR